MLRGIREIFAVNLIKLACDGDAISYSSLARAARGLSLETMQGIAARLAIAEFLDKYERSERQ